MGKPQIMDQQNNALLTDVQIRENVPATVSSCNGQPVQTGSTCRFVTDMVGGLSNFLDVISPGCRVPPNTSPCGFEWANQQWQWCPVNSPPTSTGTIGHVVAHDLAISVHDNFTGLTPGTIFPK